jgi:hypothetical protein
MKGSLHTDELMAAVVPSATGLRTERRISHVFAMDVPTYPRPLFITDAAINIYPTLEDKVDILKNAIQLAQALNISQPKVAILSAVETVNPKIPATIDAAALCKMADRGQIEGALIDGPLAFDNAISKEAALIKGIHSPVAGEADILLVPDWFVRRGQSGRRDGPFQRRGSDARDAARRRGCPLRQGQPPGAADLSPCERGHLDDPDPPGQRLGNRLQQVG